MHYSSTIQWQKNANTYYSITIQWQKEC